MNIRITRAQLTERAQQRPPGYEADVLSHAVIFNNDWLELTPTTHAALREKYAPAPPTLVELAGNFSGAVTRWVAAGFPIVDPSAYAERLAACEACDDYDAERQRCARCGCKKHKLWLATEKCPGGLWPTSS